MTRENRYWDSTAFLAWLLPEPDRKAGCLEVIRAAERGELLIVTSAVTLTEVIKLKGLPPLKQEQEAKIRKFFLNPYIAVRNVDRFVAEDARTLIWQHGLHPKDSIHVATALRARIPILDTYDNGLIALDKKLGVPLMEIRTPSMPQREIDLQPPKPLPAVEQADSDEPEAPPN